MVSSTTGEEFRKAVADRMKALRLSTGLNARDLSIRMGMNPGFVHSIENQTRFPSPESWTAIFDYFRIEPKDFFDFGVEYPALIQETLQGLKKLDKSQVILINQMVDQMIELNELKGKK